ncbi:MAG: hypothetical protein O3A63_09865 [Proteobacteria bacterium]|nr:hypothetical protein [Pseudomonadota bacterium]
MNDLPLFPVAFTVVWVCAALVCIGMIFRHTKKAGLMKEHAMLMGAIALAALAPCTALIVYAVSGSFSFFGVGIQGAFAAFLLVGAWRARWHRQDPQRHVSSMAFKEKSAFLVLLALLVVFTGYYSILLSAGLGVSVGVFIGSVVMLVIIMIIGHAALALFHAPVEEVDQALDERDVAVERLSIRNAYYLLLAGIWVIPVMALADLSGLLIANAAFAVILISELVYYTSMVTYYRRGAI